MQEEFLPERFREAIGDGDTGLMVMTSTSPAFSLGVPGLIQVLVAQMLAPHLAILTRALPSPRAQLPSSVAAWLAPATPNARTNALAIKVFIEDLLWRLINRVDALSRRARH